MYPSDLPTATFHLAVPLAEPNLLHTILGTLSPFWYIPNAFLPLARSANTVRPKQKRQSYSPIYQFQLSSSSSFSSILDICGDPARPDTVTMSGNIARPRAVLPASSSSSSSDCAGGAHAGASFAVEADASAEKIDCETSENISEARCWLLENLNKQRTMATVSPRHNTGHIFFFVSLTSLFDATLLIWIRPNPPSPVPPLLGSHVRVPLR